MRSKQSFEVGVRILGLIGTVFALLYFIDALICFFVPSYRPQHPAWRYLVDGAVLVPISLYLLRGGSHIVRFAFPKDDSEPSTKHDA